MKVKPLKIIHTKLFDYIDVPPSKMVNSIMVEKGILPENKDEITNAMFELNDVRVWYTVPDAFIKRHPSYKTLFLGLSNGLWFILSYPIAVRIRLAQPPKIKFIAEVPKALDLKKLPIVLLVLGDKLVPIDAKNLLEVVRVG